jgi:hypothetical protein
MKQGTFPGAGLADNPHHLAPAHLKRQILKEHQFVRARAEGLLKSFDPERLLS